MRFEYKWSNYSVEAEIESFGTFRLVKAQNELFEKMTRYEAALDTIARTTSSYDPCRAYVDIARRVLNEERK